MPQYSWIRHLGKLEPKRGAGLTELVRDHLNGKDVSIAKRDNPDEKYFRDTVVTLNNRSDDPHDIVAKAFPGLSSIKYEQGYAEAVIDYETRPGVEIEKMPSLPPQERILIVNPVQVSQQI